jgi:cysteine desulfurase
MRTIYLDYNATTPVAPAVREAMLPYLAEQFGNPSSSHALGRYCHEAVAEARRQMASFLGAEHNEIVFTSGGTESNNLAIKGVALAGWQPGMPGHLVISAIEHPAVVEPARFLQKLGFRLSVVGVNRAGMVDPAAIEKALASDTRLVSVMHANNEIGTLQPIRQIADICHRRGVLVHSDAAQSIGKVPVRVDDLAVDLLTVAAHKVYAPKGVGALYIRRGTRLEPLLHGASHERGLRAGTENVAYIVGLGRAASLADDGLANTGPRMARLRDRLNARLRDAIGGGLTVNGEGAPRLPNTLSVNFPNAVGDELLRRTPDLCASTGAACHSGSTKLSATLAAIGLESQVARGTIRLSVGWYTSDDEIDLTAEMLIAAWKASI